MCSSRSKRPQSRIGEKRRPIHPNRIAIATACAALLIADCAGRPPEESAGAGRRVSEAYVRLALALAERDPDSLDSYFGPPAWRAAAQAQRRSLADVQASARALSERLARSPVRLKADATSGVEYDPTTRAFLIRQLRATVARIDVVAGPRPSFAEESQLLFGTAPPPVDSGRAASARKTLDRSLPGRGSLIRRLAAFHQRVAVPLDRLPSVVARALAECRAATLRRIALPSDERVAIGFVDDLQWTALTHYSGDHKSQLMINMNAGLSADDVLQLACHEAYPGHHTINVLVDDALVKRVHRTDLVAQMRFSPQALLAEGAASIAPQLAFADADRVRIARVLFELAGLDARDAGVSIQVRRAIEDLAPTVLAIAARYVDGELEFARAAAALERDALMSGSVEFLKYLNEFRTYAVTYVRGPELAGQYLDAHAPRDDTAARWRAYVELVTNPGQAFEK